MSQEPEEHNWSNAETKAIAYYLFEYEGDVTPFNEKAWLENLILEHWGEDSADIARIAFYHLTGEPGYPDPRIKQAAERLRDIFFSGLLADIQIPEVPLRRIIFEYWETDPSGEERLIGRHSLPDSDKELLMELFGISLDRVNWEEIVSVWLEGQADKEEPGE